MERDTSREDLEIVRRILNASTYCDVLNIRVEVLQQPDAKSVLKRSYYKLSLQVHPDKNAAPKAQEAFALLSHCYDELKTYGVDKKIGTTKSESQTKPTTKRADDFVTEVMNKMRQNKSRGGESKAQQTFDDIFEEMMRKKTNKAPCQAYNQNDVKCKKSAESGKPYCHVHRDYTGPKPKPPKPIKRTCQAKTKGGEDCTKSAQLKLPYCHTHVNYDVNAIPAPVVERVKCSGLTKAGGACRNYALEGGQFCKRHSE